MAALVSSPTPKDETDRRIAALTEHFEADRTSKAVDAALQAACAAADETPRPRVTLRLKTPGGGVECWVLETHDGAAHAFRCGREGADADVAASMEMSLATFLRLAARRLKTSRAVLAGQARASGHRRSLERWGSVLSDAKSRLADALDLKTTDPPQPSEKRSWFWGRSKDWKCAVSALKSQTSGGRWRLKAEIRSSTSTRDVTVDCKATDAACGEELRRELTQLQRAVSSALGVDEAPPELPEACSFTGGRVCRVSVHQKGSVVLVSILACAPGAVHGAITTTSLDLRETDDVHVAIEDINAEISGAWKRLTRKERSRSKSPMRSPLRQVNAGEAAWEPPAKRAPSSTLETACLNKLHRGKPAFLERLVRKANF